MSVLKITVQHQTRDGYPVVAEHSQSDRYVVRAERRMLLDEDALLDLQACGEGAEYGRMLGEALFQGSLRDLFLRARALSADRMHLMLCIEPVELRALGWERLQAPLDDGRWDFVALDQRVPLSIYIPSSADRRFVPFGAGELRALVLAASPRRLQEYGLSPFDALGAAARIGSAMAPIPGSMLVSAEAAPQRIGPPSLDALCEALTAERFTLLHIICHGQLRPDGETVLYLEGPNGEVKPITAAQLIGRLGRLRGAHGLPHLIFLAACETAHPGAEAALGGLGQRLVRELGMPAVVAMTARVSLELATELARRFYPRLRAHGAVDLALVEANAGLAEHADVLVPALYSRLGDRPLFSDRDDGRALTAIEIERGLARLAELMPVRAPALQRELTEAAGAALRALDRIAGSEDAAPGLSAALLALDMLSSEAAERTFRHLALGRPLPEYDGRCPFAGLSAFRATESAFFFGREDLVARLSERLLLHRFLAVLGPSGSGKSSVVLAGVVPTLQRRNPALRIAYMTPGREPLQGLDRALCGRTERGAHAGSAESSLQRVLIIDQFEETFTLCAADQRAAFFDRLLELRQQAAVVLTMRADFWGECASHAELKAVMLAHQELVGPMSTAELRRAIEQQAGAVGLRLEDGLCATMLAAMEDEPGGMPLLQHTLLELWKRRRGSWLRAQEYRSLGGVQLAIAETAEAVYQQIAVTPDEQQRLRDVFTRLTQLDEVSPPDRKPRDSRRRVRFSELVPAGSDPEVTRRIITQLADARLLVTRADTLQGEQEVEVAHEAVIRHWPRLRGWLDEDRIGIGLREGVRQAAREWLAGERSEHLLLHRGERLRLLHERTARHVLNRSEQDYVDACRHREEEEQRQKEEQHRREQQYARELAVALDRALAAARTAQSQKLAMHAAALREREPMLAFLVAREAARLRPTAEALSQLQHLLTGALEYAVLSGHGDAIVACAHTAAGDLLVSASVDRTARIWEPDGRERAVLRGHQDALLGVAWSPDGAQVLTLSSDKTARLWSRDGGLLAVLQGHHGAVLAGSFSADGARVLTCSGDHTARLWDRSGGLQAVLTGHQDALTAGCFSPDGARVLTTSRDRTARVWSLAEESSVILRGHTAAVSGGCFSPDGQQLLTGSWDGTARLWSADGAPLATLSGHQDRVLEGSFSPDGDRILTVSRDRTARLWDRGGRPVHTLRGHEKAVQSGRFSPDGDRVLTVSGDQTARLWARDGEPIAVLRGHDKGVQAGCFTSEGTRVATVSWDATIRLFSSTGSCSSVLRGHSAPLVQCCLSPDGRLVLTSAKDGTARLWRCGGEGRLHAVLHGHTDLVSSALFSRDGALILTTSKDGSACLWSRDGALLRRLTGANAWVVCGALSPDGARVATAAMDGAVHLLDRAGASLSIVAREEAALTGCAFSPSGDALFISSVQGVARVLDLEGRQRALLRGHRDVASGCYSPDGAGLLTTSWDGTAALWSADGAERARLLGHEAAILGGSFSPDGSCVLTFSRDQTARIWSAEGRLVAVLRGHHDWVLAACFSHGGRAVLTVSRDHTAQLWQLDGKSLMTLRGHADWVTAGSFTPDDQQVVTASADHTARIWPATIEALEAAMSRHAVRGLTARERDTYLDFEQE